MSSSDPPRSPERGLCAAIIKQSIDDLTDSNALIRDEAKAFWTARFGGMAKWRRLYLAQLDIDDERARARVAQMLEENAGSKLRMPTYRLKPIFQEVLEVIPDGEFTLEDISVPGLTQQNIQAALHTLNAKGLIRCVGKKKRFSLWVRTGPSEIAA